MQQATRYSPAQVRMIDAIREHLAETWPPTLARPTRSDAIRIAVHSHYAAVFGEAAMAKLLTETAEAGMAKILATKPKEGSS